MKKISASDYSIGLMHEVAVNAAKAEFYPQDLHQLSVDELKTLLQIRSGYAEVKPIEHMIDCDHIPPDFNYYPVHISDGKFQWDLNKVELYQHPEQLQRRMVWTEVYASLDPKRFLNVNVMAYLLAKRSLIPREWEGCNVIFLGTCDPRPARGEPAAPCLCRDSDMGGWEWANGSVQTTFSLRSNDYFLLKK